MHRIAVLQALACGSVLAKACVVRVKCDGNPVSGCFRALNAVALNAVALNDVAINAVAINAVALAAVALAAVALADGGRV